MTIRRHLLELRPGITRQIFRLSLAMVASIAFSPLAIANVTGEGDVSPVGPTDLPIGGGVATADVIVGDTGAGRLTIDAPAFTDPLNSPNGIIGNTVSGIGQVSISGFDLDQSAWEVDTMLTVGLSGLGILDLTGGGLLSVGDDTATPGLFTTGDIIVGDALFSQGIMNVSGFATMMETKNMVFGEEGFATVTVSSQALLRSETSVIGMEVGSIGHVTLTGLGTRWISTELSDENFKIAEDGRGTLEILDQAIVFNARDVTIGENAGSHGTVRVSGVGSLWQIDDDSGSDDLLVGGAGFGELYIANGGLVRVDNDTTVTSGSFVELSGGGILQSASLVNNGVIRGAGRLESVVTIGSVGELRNAAGVSPLREYTHVSGAVTNNGTIESLGGEMEFEGAVTNNLEIVARDAVMRFNGGLTNTGIVSLGGDTTLHGLVTNSGGQLVVLSDSSPLLVGDLAFTSGILALSIGDAPGTLDVTGSANLSGAIFDLNYSAGVLPQPGDSYQIFQAGGGIAGAFPASASDGTNIWDITNPGGGTALFATFNGVAATPVGADFNGDGTVDALDIAIWQTFYPIASGATKDLGDADGDGDVDGADFMKIQRDFGVIPVPPFSGGAVPEPSSIALLMLGGVLAIGRRSRHVR